MKWIGSRVWLVVNARLLKRYGLPRALLTQPLPKAVGVFTTQEIGEQAYSMRGPLPADCEFMALMRDEFYTVLKRARDSGLVETVAVNMATPGAELYPIEEVLDFLAPQRN